MMDSEVLATVRERVSPSEDELERLNEVSAELESAVQEVAAENDFDVIGITRAGSTARGTFVSGDRDIDLFVEFDPNISSDELEEQGLTIGREVLPDGENDFASHPYRKGEVDGFDIDLVPCFGVESTDNMKSAVDRTPFHTRYLESRLTPELASDVRVAKSFLKGIGAYGSDVRTEGFSGLLTELLVLKYDGFIPLLEAASSWSPPITIDLEGHAETEFNDALVVIDPTDPNRNVAANLKQENVHRLQINARQFLREPDESYFNGSQRADAETVTAEFAERETHVNAIVMPRPDVVGDTLFPQLQRTRESLVNSLQSEGFEVVRSMDMATDTHAVIFIEYGVHKLPNVEVVRGPPVEIQEASERFMNAYKDEDDVVGPYIDGFHLVVERPREFRESEELINSDKMYESVAMRDAVEEAFKSDDRNVLYGQEGIERLIELGFAEELTQYVDPKL